MAVELHRFPGLDGIAASAINVGQPVVRVGGDTQRRYKPVGSGLDGQFVDGLAAATAVNPGDPVTVYDNGHIVKVTAGASIGAGAETGLASTNGALGPVAAASGVAHYSVGVSESAAAAGETFGVYVRPRRLSDSFV